MLPDAPRRHVLHLGAAEHDAPPLHRTKPGDGLGKFALTVPVDPGDAEDLSLPDGERDAAQLGQLLLAGDEDVLHGEGDLPLRRRDGRAAEEDLAPHHQARQLGSGCRGSRHRRDVLSSPHHGDPVADREHFLQLVGDEDDGLAPLFHRAQNAEELFGFLGCEHGGRLVEDEDLRAPVERLDDLDALGLPDGDLLHLFIRMHAESVGLRIVFDFVEGRLPVDAPSPPRFKAEDDVLQHRHLADEHELLVHHADPEPDRLFRRQRRIRFSLDGDAPLLGNVHAVENLHESGLPRSVLSYERVDLSLLKREQSVLDRLHSGEFLADAFHFDQDTRHEPHLAMETDGEISPPPPENDV